MKGFKETNIYVEGKGVIKTSLLVENHQIAKIGNVNEENLDSLPDNLILVPGFIDEHIHGAFGHDVMEATPTALREIASHLPNEGVTYFCPTTMSMGIEDIKTALQNIATYVPDKGEAMIVGIHLEGPFLSEKYCGAQNPKFLMDCDEDILKHFIESSKNNLRIVTFACERGGENIIPTLIKNDIVPSLGHSDANAEQAREAIAQGARLATHCYNAMRGIHHRDVGLLGEIMLDDSVMTELIADLKHVSPDAVRLLFKTKGKERIILVSDSMEAKYLPDGHYSLGGQNVLVKDGTARLDSGVLAGSVLRLDEALANIAKIMPQLSFTEIIDLVTKNPAKNLNINNIGAIKVGNLANFTVVDKNFKVIKTIVL
ncbi:MAG: N-acetylglucosamine-6-phosphate deacetylase [Bacilli bacterium]|jgi:N-acetylglucosamine-6-phosphate deacetylase